MKVGRKCDRMRVLFPTSAEAQEFRDWGCLRYGLNTVARYFPLFAETPRLIDVALSGIDFAGAVGMASVLFQVKLQAGSNLTTLLEKIYQCGQKGRFHKSDQ